MPDRATYYNSEVRFRHRRVQIDLHTKPLRIPATYCGGSLGVLGESLYMGTTTWSGAFVIRVMNEENCWTKLTTIQDFNLSESFEVIRVFNNGNILMLSHKDKKLYMYTFEGQKNGEITLKIQGLDESSIQFIGVIKVVPSFLSLKHTPL